MILRWLNYPVVFFLKLHKLYDRDKACYGSHSTYQTRTLRQSILIFSYIFGRNCKHQRKMAY